MARMKSWLAYFFLQSDRHAGMDHQHHVEPGLTLHADPSLSDPTAIQPTDTR